MEAVAAEAEIQFHSSTELGNSEYLLEGSVADLSVGFLCAAVLRECWRFGLNGSEQEGCGGVEEVPGGRWWWFPLPITALPRSSLGHVTEQARNKDIESFKNEFMQYSQHQCMTMVSN